METLTLLCTNCQVFTKHAIVLDGNGEYVTTCSVPNCEHFLKFPGDDNQLLAHIEVHNSDNLGQVKVDDSGNPIMSAEQQAIVAAAAIATNPTTDSVDQLVAPVSPVITSENVNPTGA